MNLSALFSFLLALLGVDAGHSTFVDRVSVDGAQALYSKATVEAGVARFECLRSESGHCYYTLFPRDCSASPTAAKKTAGCLSEPIEHFAVANGDSRQIAGLRDFRLCVSGDDGTPGPACQLPPTKAAR